ncbi:hypothetical protein ACJJTC_004875 [Scirpophaga incertulas]
MASKWGFDGSSSQSTYKQRSEVLDLDDLSFAMETSDFVKQEEAAMSEEINNISTSKYGNFEINHELHMTMIDGKIATILTQIFSRPVRDEVYKYGLSTLHMWIRCMECLLHISYNLDFKMWSPRGENKALKKARKNITQTKFKEQMGLLVDIVKQGFGTTNDGNTATKFFREYEKSA